MSAAKHTPGVLRAAEKIADWDYYGNPKAVADIISCETAAPEMLEALKRSQTWLETYKRHNAVPDGGPLDADIASNRGLIARAEGNA